MALVLVIAAIAVKENHFTPLLLILPLYMVLLGLFSVGIGWIAASLQVYLRDTVQMDSVVLTFWFWLTPIFITESQVPARLRFLLAGNPLAYIGGAYRQALLTYWPPSVSEPGIGAMCATANLLPGGLLLRHIKSRLPAVL